MSSGESGLDRRRDYNGPALFRQGFRPFFFAAGLWAALALPLWLGQFLGAFELPLLFGPLAWHAHEMIFGFAGAVIAGFLLTAVPNWTGRLPVQGTALMVLAGCWLLGRLAMAVSGLLGALPTAVLDLAFPLLLLALALREIVAGRNWRNLPLPLALAVLLAANALTHLEAAGLLSSGSAGQRLGVAAVIMLICLIGGRILPSFTRNWLAKRGATTMPLPFGSFDKLCLLVTAISLVAWVALPDHAVVGGLLLLAGVLNAMRLARWQGLRSLPEPLLWSLHLGFLWVPLGLMLLALGIVVPEVPATTAGLHALTAGAIGAMTLAVMTRASLGHSGRALTADSWTTMVYLLVNGAAALRVVASLALEAYMPLLHASGALWTAAFGLFVLRYAPLYLSGHRAKG
ncbi:NnrS family protein [Pelagibius marinus]|uniref:NnrS family protein n=1 Tax=Pelagibius marinus TaxID=2762760 RepID=UPI0018723D02|nr:NnrS family protein [Pelagibius marinus]